MELIQYQKISTDSFTRARGHRLTTDHMAMMTRAVRVAMKRTNNGRPCMPFKQIAVMLNLAIFLSKADQTSTLFLAAERQKDACVQKCMHLGTDVPSVEMSALLSADWFWQ